jgi:hypothetical protein
MKYIKLFENFESSSIDDAKWIVISHLGEVEELWSNEDCIKLKLDDNPTEDQIESCKAHLEDEGFFFEIKTNDLNHIIWNRLHVIVGVGSSLEDYSMKWLKDNFSNLDIVSTAESSDDISRRLSYGLVLYRYKEGDNIIVKLGNSAYISRQIWNFFKSNFDFSRDEIQKIIKEWLSEVYNIDVDKPEENVWPHFQKLK